jgi:hypothetical protein
VIWQVRQLLPMGWRASLLAVDGATTEDVPSQLQHVPPDASHLVLSVGGNDALMNASILHTPADSTSQAVAALAEISRGFEERYRRVVAACRKLPLSLTLCTIYNGCFPDANYGNRNDPLMLRRSRVCSGPAEFAVRHSPISSCDRRSGRSTPDRADFEHAIHAPSAPGSVPRSPAPGAARQRDRHRPRLIDGLGIRYPKLCTTWL